MSVQPHSESTDTCSFLDRREVSRWLMLVFIMLTGQFIAAAEWLTMDLPRGIRLLFTAVLGGDSSRYLDGPIGDETFPYASYIAITQLITATGATPLGVVMFQMLVSVVAGRCLLALGTQFYTPFSGWFAASWFLLYFQIAQWTRYILTESLFFSISIIIMWLVLHQYRRYWMKWMLLLPLLLLMTFMRPNGLMLVGSLATFLLLKKFGTALSLIAISVLWPVIIGIQRTVPLFTSHNDSQIFDRFVGGEVFWNQTEFQRSMPAPAEPILSLGDFTLYLLNHPFDSLTLVLSRIGWELIQVRAWNADYYNLVLIASMFVFYALATLGWYKKRGTSLNLFVWSVTVPSVVLIGFTWAIYEARFAWWFLVTWIPWVGIGADLVRQKLIERNRVRQN